MAHTTIKPGQIISLDSLDSKLSLLNDKSYETDLIIDDEIFDNETTNWYIYNKDKLWQQ